MKIYLKFRIIFVAAAISHADVVRWWIGDGNFVIVNVESIFVSDLILITWESQELQLKEPVAWNELSQKYWKFSALICLTHAVSRADGKVYNIIGVENISFSVCVSLQIK